MSKKIKLRLTITVDYDADPDWYDTEDPKKMAAIDEANFKAEPNHMFEIIDASDSKTKIVVAPIK